MKTFLRFRLFSSAFSQRTLYRLQSTDTVREKGDGISPTAFQPSVVGFPFPAENEACQLLPSSRTRLPQPLRPSSAAAAAAAAADSEQGDGTAGFAAARDCRGRSREGARGCGKVGGEIRGVAGVDNPAVWRAGSRPRACSSAFSHDSNSL
ncbi:hypothetical protein ACLOJK_012866 [Asimina triloba]